MPPMSKWSVHSKSRSFRRWSINRRGDGGAGTGNNKPQPTPKNGGNNNSPPKDPTDPKPDGNPDNSGSSSSTNSSNGDSPIPTNTDGNNGNNTSVSSIGVSSGGSPSVNSPPNPVDQPSTVEGGAKSGGSNSTIITLILIVTVISLGLIGLLLYKRRRRRRERAEDYNEKRKSDCSTINLCSSGFNLDPASFTLEKVSVDKDTPLAEDVRPSSPPGSFERYSIDSQADVAPHSIPVITIQDTLDSETPNSNSNSDDSFPISLLDAPTSTDDHVREDARDYLQDGVQEDDAGDNDDDNASEDSIVISEEIAFPVPPSRDVDNGKRLSYSSIDDEQYI
ncbi:3864_t:CDS:2 [Paraglomus occultum]|uniref:3864_t:CDS:1 n=1 Tax=Paraglomus occultum TaxID=144539 RepID=A0A9N8VID1_9GLOM|nr:3864_t:CDS:2 [Paraglomus occultum]